MSKILDYWNKTSFKSEQYNFKITFSFGIAIYTNNSNFEDVIDKADKAMYRHKHIKFSC